MMSDDFNVHICWLLMWAATLKYQDKKEKDFRMKQVQEVLQKLYRISNAKLNLEIFEVLMDSALKYGTLFGLLNIYLLIEEFRLRYNAAIISYILNGLTSHNLTMEHVQNHLQVERQKRRDQLKNQQTEVQRRIKEEIKRRDTNKQGTFKTQNTGTISDLSIPPIVQGQSMNTAEPTSPTKLNMDQFNAEISRQSEQNDINPNQFRGSEMS
mmetsp:Transcript_3223/g.3143  ORF Transcript_3223/g.3143 Transcript_3223/m.3143 type:complete len:211 (+) Transcript_3223:1041-1673(+)